MSSETRALIREAQDAGWRLLAIGGNHLRHPSGRSVFMAGTPSDSWRGIRNIKAEPRRQMREVPA
jgi:hypothetical protein